MTTSSTPLTHFSLFSGIGGLDLAAEWAGFRTVGQVEKNDYANKILTKHWPDVPRWGDIKDVTIHTVREAGIEHAPTVLSGGVIGENVAGLVSLALDDVLTDLERAGYSCRAFLLPAAGVGAPHMRDRVFIVAHSARELPHRSGGARHRRAEPTDGSPADMAHSNDPATARQRQNGGKVLPFSESKGSDLCRSYVADSYGERREERDPAPGSGEAGFPPWRADPYGDLWLTEPGVGRVVDGVPTRVDRLRCLGNAVVPQQVYPIFQAIAEIEQTYHSSPED